MMVVEIVFWTTSIITVLTMLFFNKVRKSWLNIFTYLILGIYIPLFMSFCDWSGYHVADRNVYFYLIFISLNLACFGFAFVKQSKQEFSNVEFVKIRGTLPVEVYNIIFISMVLVENYVVTGHLIPSLLKIDAHTGRASFIYFITTAVYIITLLNVMEFLSTRKKRYIIYAVIVFFFNIVTKYARIDAAKTFVQVLSLLSFYYFSRRKVQISKEGNLSFKKKSRLPLIFLALILVFLIVNYWITLGNDRMNSFGLYKTVYSDGIAYTGPIVFGEMLTYYYGYFSLSFDNLAYNLLYTPTHPNFIGLNTFRTAYFGILQFDNLFGLNGGAAPRANQIRCRGAAVTTGFWDMFYDYDILVIIPIIISFILVYYLQKKFYSKSTNASIIALYFYWIPLWMFMSFDNRVYDYEVLWHVAIILLVFKRRYQVVFDQILSKEEIVARSQKRKRYLRSG